MTRRLPGFRELTDRTSNGFVNWFTLRTIRAVGIGLWVPWFLAFAAASTASRRFCACRGLLRHQDKKTFGADDSPCSSSAEAQVLPSTVADLGTCVHLSLPDIPAFIRVFLEITLFDGISDSTELAEAVGPDDATYDAVAAEYIAQNLNAFAPRCITAYRVTSYHCFYYIVDPGGLCDNCPEA